MIKYNYKDFEHDNLGVSLDSRLGLPNILINTYALGFRHIVIDLSPEEVLGDVFPQDQLLAYRTHSYSIFTYLRCRNLMLSVPPSRLKKRQQACFMKLYKLAKVLRSKALIVNTAPNIQRSSSDSFNSTVRFLEDMLKLCDNDIAVYLETTPPAPSHIGHIESLRTIAQALGNYNIGIALNSSHVNLWKFDQIGLQITNIDWCLLEYGEYVKLVFLHPNRPHQSLEDEGESWKIRSIISNFPGILARTRLSDVFTEKDFILFQKNAG